MSTHFILNAAKLLQTDIGAWRDCAHLECKERQSCTGGPRGTATRTGGWPICTAEGKARLEENIRMRSWEPSETYKNETQRERSLRRAAAEFRKLEILMLKNSLHSKS